MPHRELTPEPVEGGAMHDLGTCRDGDHYGQCPGMSLLPAPVRRAPADFEEPACDVPGFFEPLHRAEVWNHVRAHRWPFGEPPWLDTSRVACTGGVSY